jgi:hypothetical protein
VPDRHELQEFPVGVLQLLLRAPRKMSAGAAIIEKPLAFPESSIPKTPFELLYRFARSDVVPPATSPDRRVRSALRERGRRANASASAIGLTIALAAIGDRASALDRPPMLD